MLQIDSTKSKEYWAVMYSVSQIICASDRFYQIQIILGCDAFCYLDLFTNCLDSNCDFVITDRALEDLAVFVTRE